jgi:integrase
MASKFVNQMTLDNGIRPPKSGAVAYRVRHCKGLYLRVSHTGAASWAVMYRVGNGKLVKETLGKLRDLPRVEDAVRRARASQDIARVGRDPVAERREAQAQADVRTLRPAVERWLKEHVERNLRPGSVYTYERLFRHDILPKWGDRPLASIGKADILLLMNDKASSRERARKDATGGAVVTANRLLARLSAFFKWSIANDLVATDPTIGIRNVAKEKPRDRFLSDDEIRAFWRATGDRSGWSVLFRLALLTGQRSREEIGGMLWSEIDVEARTWQVPAKRSKNGKAHTVNLSALALAQLQGLARVGDRVFPAMTSFSRAKEKIDAEIAKTGPIEPWVTHDLRRTATTLMAQIGVPPHVADKVLNHTGGTIRTVAATYNRFSYIDERKAALYCATASSLSRRTLMACAFNRAGMRVFLLPSAGAPDRSNGDDVKSEPRHERLSRVGQEPHRVGGSADRRVHPPADQGAELQAHSAVGPSYPHPKARSPAAHRSELRQRVETRKRRKVPAARPDRPGPRRGVGRCGGRLGEGETPRRVCPRPAGRRSMVSMRMHRGLAGNANR